MPSSKAVQENQELTRKQLPLPPGHVPTYRKKDVPPGLMTRQKLADRLGVHVSTVRLRESLGEIRPSAYTAKGWVLYDETVLVQWAQPSKRGLPGRAAPTQHSTLEYTSEDAVKVFRALNAGKDAITTVLETGVHPRVVEAAALDWARMNAGFLMTKEYLDIINKLPLEGNFPVTTPEGLIELLRGAAADVACTTCGLRTRSVCTPCMNKKVRDKVREVVTKLERSGVDEPDDEPTDSVAAVPPVPAPSEATPDPAT